MFSLPTWLSVRIPGAPVPEVAVVDPGKAEEEGEVPGEVVDDGDEKRVDDVVVEKPGVLQVADVSVPERKAFDICSA